MRNTRGLSQKALGEALGISEQTIYFYERGDKDGRFPTAQHLAQYAKFFDVTTDYILLGDTKFKSSVYEAASLFGLSKDFMNMLYKDFPELVATANNEMDFIERDMEREYMQNRRMLINTLMQFPEIDDLCGSINLYAHMIEALQANPIDAKDYPPDFPQALMDANLWGQHTYASDRVFSDQKGLAEFKCYRLFLRFLDSLDKEE